MLTYFQSRRSTFYLVVFLFSLVAVFAMPSAFAMGEKEPSPNVDGVGASIGASIGSSFGGSIGIGGGFSFGTEVHRDDPNRINEGAPGIGCPSCFPPSGTTFYNPETLLLQNIGNIQIPQLNFAGINARLEALNSNARRDMRRTCEAHGLEYNQSLEFGSMYPVGRCTPRVTSEMCQIAVATGIGSALYYAGRICGSSGLAAGLCAGSAVAITLECNNFDSGAYDFR